MKDWIVAYVTKMDGVTRYYKTDTKEKAEAAKKELSRYTNLFKKIRII